LNRSPKPEGRSSPKVNRRDWDVSQQARIAVFDGKTHCLRVLPAQCPACADFASGATLALLAKYETIVDGEQSGWLSAL